MAESLTVASNEFETKTASLLSVTISAALLNLLNVNLLVG
jgi:hypothetical protein